MILTRTPLRITLGGGGTDLPQFYEREEGFWISGAIDKYIYILVKERFEKTLRIAYSALEYVEHPSQLEHPIFREALTRYGTHEHVEIASFAELPSRSGLGSSGAFTIGLLNALWNFYNSPDAELGIIPPTKSEFAEEGFDIEYRSLNRLVGKQDFYSASYGGVTAYTVDKKGKVSIREKLDYTKANDLCQHLSLFYVSKRQAPTRTVLSENSFKNLQKIKHIGQKSLKALMKVEIPELADLIDEHWKIKRENKSNRVFDKLITAGKKSGALSGKLVGAGAGGFLLFIHNMTDKQKLVKSLQKKSLRKINFNFEQEGVKVFHI